MLLQDQLLAFKIRFGGGGWLFCFFCFSISITFYLTIRLSLEILYFDIFHSYAVSPWYYHSAASYSFYARNSLGQQVNFYTGGEVSLQVLS